MSPPAGCLRRLFTFNYPDDNRLPRYYRSYHLGRFMLIVGSIILLIGLVIKFAFLNTDKSVISIIAIVISVFGLVLIVVGSMTTIYGALKAQKAQREDVQRRNAATTLASEANVSQNPSLDSSSYLFTGPSKK